MNKHLSSVVDVVILDEKRRRTPGITVKMLGDDVLPVSADLEDVQIVPFPPVTLQAVACCALVLQVYQLSNSSSSLLSLAMNAELAASQIEDNNCVKDLPYILTTRHQQLHLDNSSSVFQVVIKFALSLDIILR